MAVISGNLHPAAMCGQWAYMVLAYLSFIFLAGAECPHPGSLIASLAVEEAMFLAISLLCSPTCMLPPSMDFARYAKIYSQQEHPIKNGKQCMPLLLKVIRS
eukprot:4688888-Amphidinium_carterae.1